MLSDWDMIREHIAWHAQHDQHVCEIFSTDSTVATVHGLIKFDEHDLDT